MTKMLVFALFALLRGAPFLTSIEVDGFAIPGFISSTFDYTIDIPFDKKSAQVKAVPHFAAHVKASHREFVLCEGTETVVHFDVWFEGVINKYTLRLRKTEFRNEILKSDTSKRLTPFPAAGQAPLINCPRVYGASPWRDFWFNVGVSGDRPLTFSAENLPDQLKLSQNGLITGVSPESGKYKVKITVTNAVGSDSITLTIEVGGRLRLTPPIGWNAWYVQSNAISDEGMRETADYAVKSGLVNYGFTYLNLDDGWQGIRSPDPPYAMQGKRNFSIDGKKFGGLMDMRGLSQYIHSRGMKIGTYMSPKLQTYQGFLGSSSFNASGMDYNYFSPGNGCDAPPGPVCDENNVCKGNKGKPGVLQPSQLYGHWGGYGQSVSWKVGDHWFGDVDIKQWASWGLDYVKWDWSIHADKNMSVDLVTRIMKSVRDCGRDIVVSLSNGPGDAEFAGRLRDLGASLCRTGQDARDNWGAISAAAKRALDFIELTERGFWPDPDMLQIGYLAVGGDLNMSYHKSRLSEDEQYFQLTFWMIYPAPIIMSCDLAELDDFTTGLMTNREINLVNQDELGLHAVNLSTDLKVFVKKLVDGSVAVATLNWNEADDRIIVDFAAVTKAVGVDFSKGANVRNLWAQKDEGLFKGSFTSAVKRHGALMYRLIPVTSGRQSLKRT